MELLDNTEYLIKTILPMLQEVQRDTAKMPRISCSVSVNNDNGMISVGMTYYKKDLQTIDSEESKQFSFFSHEDNDELGDKYNKLIGYVREHTA